MQGHVECDALLSQMQLYAPTRENRDLKLGIEQSRPKCIP